MIYVFTYLFELFRAKANTEHQVPRATNSNSLVTVDCRCVLVLTDDSEELVGAAVREEAAHGVPMWQGGQTFHTVFMGLMVSGTHNSSDEEP